MTPHDPAAPGAPSPDDPWLWREPFRVRAYEVGPDERATVLALCDYFQEAAGEHARAAGVETFALPRGGPGVWVMRRLGLRLLRRPVWRERVVVETWPSRYEGLLAHRDFVVRRETTAATTGDEAGDEREAASGTGLLAFGTSAWFVIDAARRRPVRLPEGVAAFGPPAGSPRALVLGDEPAPLSAEHGASEHGASEHGASEHGASERRFRVRRSDLDRNAHANNVRFAEWTLEAVPEAVQTAHALSALDVSFKAEAVYGDTVVSHALPIGAAADGAGSLAFAHMLFRGGDGRTLALARSSWRLLQRH